ncbi:sorting nexin-19-like [Ruditapes philippinarum]|uniref:sorting nexin-19-like n=1 Tax=Ruditapes philippinarum TaxID=129788 RepID=UPI00295AFA34|nr:sorting nexin-19-like [Ruditapes philippinarum]
MLLVHLLREDMHDSKALFCALKEILTCNVLQKVMDLLSDTTFLHERIIKITSDEEICASIESIPLITVSESETKKVQSILSQRIVSNSIAESEHIPDVISDKQDDGTSDKVKDDSFSVKWKEDIELHSVSEGLCNECNRLCSADKDRIPPRPHSCSLGRTPVFFDISEDPERLSLQSFNSVSSTSSKDSATFASSEKHESDVDMQQSIPNELHEPSLIQKDENSALKPENSSSLKGSNLSKKDSTSSSELPVNDNVLESPSGLDNKSSSNIFPSLKIPLFPSFPFKRPSFKSLSPTLESAVSSDMKNKSKNDIKRSHSQGDLTPVSDDMQWPVQRPSVFQDVRITSTEKAKEVGSFGEYTLYNVEYEALYQSDVGELVYKSGTVKRRFKEFINLQSRLEDNPVYKKSMKDVKGPKKILPSLPFGNMGKDTVDSRKELLETFLTSLVGKEDICNGEELKQFLGYCGDGHIAFVRKVPENTGPRIDQRLVKTMSGVFDKIVEGLPSLPQQLPRIIPPINQRDEKDDTPGDKPTEDTDDIDLDYEEDINKMSTHKVENVFEKFIEQESNTLQDETGGLDTTLGTSVITWQDEQGNNSSHMTHSPHKIDATSHVAHSAKNTPHSSALSHLNELETPLSDAVLGILTEVLQRQDHWMCRENVKQAASVLIGKGLNRFLEEKVDFLTSTEMNIFYLKTLSETIWPNGKLSTEESRHYTDLQKEQLKQQATRCLAEFLPGILQIFVGHEEFDEALKDVIESLKYEKLNRHFWYTVFDVILEELFPEVNTQGFQRKLSAAVQFQ